VTGGPAGGRRRGASGRYGASRRGGHRAARGPLLVGLTGGIASGKSLVAGYLRDEGIPVIDTDRIGHELIRPGGRCYRPMVRLFGRSVQGRGGRIERARVARIIFSDARSRRRLNALLHPPILDEAGRRARALYRRRRCPIVAVSAALLVEARAARLFDRIVLVAARPEVQMERLRRRDRLSQADAEARLAAQATDARRRQIAHYVIDNTGSRSLTRAQVGRVVEALRRLARLRGLLAAGASATARPAAPVRSGGRRPARDARRRPRTRRRA
jgi:dephospho-CoA kinase